MKLSSIKTADQLILALASAGYVKASSSNRGNITDPFFSCLVTCCPTCSHERQAIWIYPQQPDHDDDLGLVADLDRTGEITGWHLVEHYAGSFQPFDPIEETTVPESIGGVLQNWMDEVIGSHS